MLVTLLVLPVSSTSRTSRRHAVHCSLVLWRPLNEHAPAWVWSWYHPCALCARVLAVTFNRTHGKAPENVILVAEKPFHFDAKPPLLSHTDTRWAFQCTICTRKAGRDGFVLRHQRDTLIIAIYSGANCRCLL